MSEDAWGGQWMATKLGGFGRVPDLDNMSPAWTGWVLRSLQSRGFLSEEESTLSDSGQL